ncbi:MAG: antirestriction protein ArdA [Sneathiella sp.]
MNEYHATPYDISAAGFYFKTYEEYLEKAAHHTNDYGDKVEEFEIQFIDGDNYELFKALSISQANLELWFDDYEDLDGDELIRAIYLAQHIGYDADDILHRLDDIYLFEGSAQEYAEQYLEDTGLLNEIPDHLQFYFDVERFANDMLLGGDITEVTIQNTRYIAQES